MDQAERLRSIFKDRSQMNYSNTSNCRVISVSSGKGGVGKTNITVNLAVNFRNLNKKVIIIDADFGLANIEVLFGISPKYSMLEVLNGTMSIADVLTEGPKGIQFISGGAGIRELNRVNDMQMKHLIDNFSLLDNIADIILIDTGAGISNTVTNFIKASSEAIIITTPEPTSITDAYALIKILKTDSYYTVPDIKVIVNKVDNNNEGNDVFLKLHKVSERFLDVNINSLGYIPYDPLLVRAVKMQQPISMCFPNSNFSRSVDKIASKLLDVNVSNKKTNGVSNFMKKLINIFNS